MEEPLMIQAKGGLERSWERRLWEDGSCAKRKLGAVGRRRQSWSFCEIKSRVIKVRSRWIQVRRGSSLFNKGSVLATIESWSLDPDRPSTPISTLFLSIITEPVDRWKLAPGGESTDGWGMGLAILLFHWSSISWGNRFSSKQKLVEETGKGTILLRIYSPVSTNLIHLIFKRRGQSHQINFVS